MVPRDRASGPHLSGLGSWEPGAQSPLPMELSVTGHGLDHTGTALREQSHNTEGSGSGRSLATTHILREGPRTLMPGKPSLSLAPWHFRSPLPETLAHVVNRSRPPRVGLGAEARNPEESSGSGARQEAASEQRFGQESPHLPVMLLAQTCPSGGGERFT